jgi:predicted outer membrane repeat protein
MQVTSAMDNSLPTVTDCVFLDNHANGKGGAIDVRSVTGNMKIERCDFYKNTACQGGGAIALTATLTVMLTDSRLMSNSAVVRGCAGNPDTFWSLAPGGAIYQVRCIMCRAGK